ncbi:MAG: L-threonylcarbamoyladenylate synthase [Deltaproteobacteria bacterium]|nr:L-threonylcarbamoyladenylate synthase [Deltaproteobacteria bacterium]MBW2419005.1 L-threonylcarbamoyladenylate synthase [Deltaproteobacteria bacterium]
MDLEDELGVALDRLAVDGLVAFPSETVWGLGARAISPDAVAKLRAWKGRSEARPISLLVDGFAALEGCGFAPSPLARTLMEQFWPGPVTFVLLPEEGGFAAGIAREDGAVGLRCSAHPAAASLARGARERGLGPITATSLNPSGSPAARTRDEAQALADLCEGKGDLLCFAPGGCDAGGEAPSSVIDLTGPEPRILRPGPRDREILAAAGRAAE